MGKRLAAVMRVRWPELTRRQSVLYKVLEGRRGLVLALPCKRCGVEVRPGEKRCRVCGVSSPGTVLRASIVKPTILALLWLVLLIVACWLW
jgi:hypothetical protein